MSVFVIAEAGVNHNGSFDLAKKLVDVAKQAKADAVKFQTFRADSLVTRSGKQADYQIENTGKVESQQDMIRRLELSFDDFRELQTYCEKVGILFLSTAFDLDSLKFLAQDLKIPKIKIPSGEATNAGYLLEVAKLRRPIYFSTGMCTLAEIRDALGVLAFGLLGLTQTPNQKAFKEALDSPGATEVLRKFVTLLHCVTEYPAPLESTNLKAMDLLKKTFGLDVGFSDHSLGLTATVAAVARGACVVEKHFTLDKSMEGPDHKASLNPQELIQLVTEIRNVERCLGVEVKAPSPEELKNLAVARRSLVALRAIRAGEKFSEDNLTVKRPGTGVSAMEYFDWLNRSAKKNYEPDDILSGE